MARWEPNAKRRFVVAAVDLFTEQGYDVTTVHEIAERAGLTKTTFFRHFRDKREVLFGGQDVHIELMAGGVAAAPEDARLLDLVRAGIEACAAAFGEDRREFSARLQRVIATNPELQERSAFKQAALARGLAEALRGRGIADPAAGLAAEIGVSALLAGLHRWTESGERRPLTELASASLEELRIAAAKLASVD